MAVTLLTLVLALLSSVQGMLIVFKARDDARLGQIRALSEQIGRARAESEAASGDARPQPVVDRVDLTRSAPELPQAQLLAVQEPTEPAPGSPGAQAGAHRGLRGLVDLANFMARERLAAVVEWRGKLAILYQRVEPEGSNALWEILNVLSDLKLLGNVMVLAEEADGAKAASLKKALVDFGVPEERIQVGTRSSPGEVITGVLLTTHADA
ncbi:MAG: hypothetical protein IT285_12255 [Bdellovibrionales bacterium]|nr:hypothetical protein [Bdellovibrionales bacterium]